MVSFPSVDPILDSMQLAIIMADMVVICFFVVWIRSRL